MSKNPSVCLSAGSRDQKREQKSSEQVDGSGSERDQRKSWSSSGEGDSTEEDLVKIAL